MGDSTIFGIDSNVIIAFAEIAAAIVTMILVYFTYQSVKISRITLESLKDQVIIARKDLENKQIELDKPKILDELKEVLNPLSEEINQELNQIDEKTFLWRTRGYRGDPLFTQLKSSSDFYTDADINTRLGLIIYEIDTRFPRFRELCQKRYKIYLSLSDVLKSVHNEIKKPEIDEKVDKLIEKYNPPHERYDADNDFSYDVVPVSEYEDGMPTDYEEFPIEEFKLSIIDCCITELLVQRIIPHNKYEKMIVSEYSSYEKDLKAILKSQSFDENSESFHSLIKDFMSTNTELKKEILEIKMEYREKYHLNDTEYWTIFKNTT